LSLESLNKVMGKRQGLGVYKRTDLQDPIWQPQPPVPME
jgi:hypothetical protein